RAGAGRARAASVVPWEARAERRARGEGIEASVMSEERRRAVREALAELSEEQREALVLARYHGMPYAEIAETLGISVGAVKTRIFRAVEALKARFGEGEHSWTAAT